MIAVLVGGLLAGLLPLSTMTTFAQLLLPTAAADMTVYAMTTLLPQPLPALAADDTDAAPTPTVILGNRLWLEDDFDGNATTGIVKPVGAGYVVRATASDGVTTYSATTDANGLYKLTVPANDTYIVTTDLPAGMFDAPVVTSTGQNPAANDNRNHNRQGTTVVVTTTDNLSIDFGFFHWEKRVALGDRVWLEDDNDGNAATGAVMPIGPGHVVTVVASDGSTTYSGVTDANGYYLILVPENDTYTVRTNQPTGVSDTPIWTNNGSNPTLHNDKNHDHTGTTVVMTITDNLSIDFGFYNPPPPPPTVNLGNYVWFDSNSDGVQNEPPSQGRDGITVTLTYPDNSTATTITANGGYYTFTNLAPNQQYLVTFALPDGLLFTTLNQGNDATDSDAPSNGQVTVNLGATDDYTIDAGLVEAPPPPPLLHLGDYVWEDLNHNGQQETDEPGIPGVTVSLTWPNGTTVVTTTNASGLYYFTQLSPNTTYTVTFGTPAGYTLTSANSGADATDSDPVQGNVIVPLGNSDDLTIDAGFVRPVTVGDRVWYDNNHDGRQDNAVSEPGVTGVLVTLYNAATNQPVLLNGAPLTDQTDGNGEYLFTDLPPGAYFVVFSNLPAGYQPTLRNVGDDAGDSDADANGRTAATPFLPSGSEDRTLDMGIWRAPASLGDFVWEDTNANGVQEQNEPSLSGVTVTLNGPTGIATTATDASGHYTFTNLLPGVVYTVTFATPSGYWSTAVNSGNNDRIDSDGTTVVVPPLQPGEHNPTIDSGFIRLLPDLVLTKQAMSSAPSIQRGAIVTYTLTYRNQGNGVATNVFITETVSAHTRFAAQKSSTGWSCNNGAPAGSQCRFALGNLQPGQSGVIVFAIQIDADVAAGTQIVNVAVIGTTLVEGESENNKDQSTVTLVGPTDLTQTQEPATLTFRLYLPVATK